VAARLLQEVDPVNGGIGGAPKFPQPTILKLLWRAWKRSGNQACRDAVELTLTRMCQGGIYDHLGGGFARYTVEERWLVPHFEKMLYDNAQLIDLLTWAWQDSGNPLYEARVRETVDWLFREMMADADETGGGPAGAFASSLDADSEGEEGKFYVWSEAEIDALLGDAAVGFKAAYDVVPGGNWEAKTILNRLQRPELGDAAEETALAESRKVLLAARGARVRPGWDDKILADWNGLMIAALARAAPVFGEAAWLAAAETAFRFVTEEMTEDGRLKHAWRRGRLNHPATLDDYANMCEAALALAQATGGAAYLAQAEAWIVLLEKRYWDGEAGGYFMTADDTERLIVRTKPIHDNAVPAGNGVMAGVLAKLHYLTGKTAYRDKAEAVIAAFSGELNHNFFPLSTLLNGSDLLQSALQVVIVGDASARPHAELLEVFHGHSLPNAVLQCVEAGSDLPDGHPAVGKETKDGRPTAYICHGPTCSLPICQPAELKTALAAR